jgi:hypothetical protein
MHLQIFFLQGEGSVVLTCFSTLQIPFLTKWVFSLLLLQTANRRSVSAGTIFKSNPTCILLFQQKIPPELLLACLTVSLPVSPLIRNPLLHKQHPKSAKLPKHPTAEENDDDDDDDDEGAAEQNDKRN